MDLWPSILISLRQKCHDIRKSNRSQFFLKLFIISLWFILKFTLDKTKTSSLVSGVEIFDEKVGEEGHDEAGEEANDEAGEEANE